MTRRRQTGAAQCLALLALSLGGGLAFAASPPPAPVLATRPIGALEARTVALLLTGQEGGALSGDVVWTIEAGGEAREGELEVALAVELDGPTLLDGSDGHRLDVALFVYALTPSGSVAAALAEGLAIDLEANGEALRAAGLRLLGRLRLTPGAYSLRVLVREHRSDRLFATVRRLEVTDPTADVPILLPPLFVAEDAAWVVAAPAAAAGAASLFTTAVGLATRASAAVVPGTATEVLIGGVGWGETTAVECRLVNADGRIVAAPGLRLGEPVDRAAAGAVYHRATVDALDAPPGRYRLFLSLIDKPGARRRSVSARLAVSASHRAAISSLAPPSDGGTGEVAAGDALEARVASDYLRLLGTLAAGDEEQTTAGLLALERGVASPRSADTVGVLDRAQRRAALELAQRSPSCLLPLALAHARLCRRYLADHDDLLAEHSWRLAADLAERLGRERKAGGPLPATLLADLAGDLVAARSIASATALLVRAIRLDPSAPAALLGLAAVQERTGGYRQATRALRRLLELEPGHAEARLRLALNLGRLGRAKQSREILRSLLGEESPAWIATVAYQELARSLVVDGSLGAAEATLRTAHARFPSDQSLQVELAHLLERRGRRAESERLLEAVAPLGGRQPPTPRLRYALWPDLGTVRLLAENQDSIERATAALGQALEEIGEDQQ